MLAMRSRPRPLRSPLKGSAVQCGACGSAGTGLAAGCGPAQRAAESCSMACMHAHLMSRLPWPLATDQQRDCTGNFFFFQHIRHGWDGKHVLPSQAALCAVPRSADPRRRLVLLLPPTAHGPCCSCCRCCRSHLLVVPSDWAEMGKNSPPSQPCHVCLAERPR